MSDVRCPMSDVRCRYTIATVNCKLEHLQAPASATYCSRFYRLFSDSRYCIMCHLWRSFYLILACTAVECFRPHYITIRNTALSAKKVWSPPPPSSEPSPPITPPLPDIQEETSTGLAFSVELPKRGAGISWGSDLSFRWVYVLDLEPTGEAYQSGLIQKVILRCCIIVPSL